MFNTSLMFELIKLHNLRMTTHRHVKDLYLQCMCTIISVNISKVSDWFLSKYEDHYFLKLLHVLRN